MQITIKIDTHEDDINPKVLAMLVKLTASKQRGTHLQYDDPRRLPTPPVGLDIQSGDDEPGPVTIYASEENLERAIANCNLSEGATTQVEVISPTPVKIDEVAADKKDDKKATTRKRSRKARNDTIAKKELCAIDKVIAEKAAKATKSGTPTAPESPGVEVPTAPESPGVEVPTAPESTKKEAPTTPESPGAEGWEGALEELDKPDAESTTAPDPKPQTSLENNSIRLRKLMVAMVKKYAGDGTRETATIVQSITGQTDITKVTDGQFEAVEGALKKALENNLEEADAADSTGAPIEKKTEGGSLDF